MSSESVQCWAIHSNRTVRQQQHSNGFARISPPTTATKKSAIHSATRRSGLYLNQILHCIQAMALDKCECRFSERQGFARTPKRFNQSWCVLIQSMVSWWHAFTAATIDKKKHEPCESTLVTERSQRAMSSLWKCSSTWILTPRMSELETLYLDHSFNVLVAHLRCQLVCCVFNLRQCKITDLFIK